MTRAVIRLELLPVIQEAEAVGVHSLRLRLRPEVPFAAKGRQLNYFRHADLDTNPASFLDLGFPPNAILRFPVNWLTSEGFATCTNLGRVCTRFSSHSSFFYLRAPQLPSRFHRN
jgi:hypothetical protein